MKVGYILSERYSGSTLLSFLLGTHREIGTIGERRKFYNKFLKPNPEAVSRCSCGDPFRKCHFWNQVYDRLYLHSKDQAPALNFSEFQLSTNKYLHWMAFHSIYTLLLAKSSIRWHPYYGTFKRLGKLNRDLMHAILEASSASVFLDSSKSLHHAAFLRFQSAMDMRIIWLVRDPRAQVSSAMKYNPWNAEKATRKWIQGYHRTEKLLSQLSMKHVVIKYHELCTAPLLALQRIADLLEIDEDKYDLNFRSHDQHIMGNFNMRLGKDQRIEERLDWLERLSTSEINLIEKMTPDFRRFYAPMTKAQV